MSNGISPLSGLPLRSVNTYVEGFDYYVGEPYGPWASSLNFAPDQNAHQARPISFAAPLQIGELDLKQAELEKLKSLALSRAVQAHLRGEKYPLFITAKELLDLQAGKLEAPKNFQPMAVEDLWRDARWLKLSEKANQTLMNLVDSEPHLGYAHKLALAFGNLGKELPQPNDSEPDVRSLIGLAYGAVDGERTLVFKALEEQGLISVGPSFNYITAPPPVNNHQSGHYVTISPQGYMRVEELRSGVPSRARTAFLVCRFIDDLDTLYNRVYKPVGDLDDVRCPIFRVKDIHHVDKIDDRIVHEINEATIVVVDLTEQNFNVAFEAGYALALKKPVVWTMRGPLPQRLPFDIQSHNILAYELDKLDEFREALKYRVLAALEKAKAL